MIFEQYSKHKRRMFYGIGKGIHTTQQIYKYFKGIIKCMFSHFLLFAYSLNIVFVIYHKNL